jgi:hypothetical protein
VPTQLEQQVSELASHVEQLAEYLLNHPIAPAAEVAPVVPAKDIGELSSAYVVRWIVALFVGYVALTGYQHYRVSIQKADNVEVAPVVDQEATWGQLKAWVSNGRIETTGELLSVAQQLELDLARLKPLIDKPAKITDSNRQSVIDLIGGVK